MEPPTRRTHLGELVRALRDPLSWPSELAAAASGQLFEDEVRRQAGAGTEAEQSTVRHVEGLCREGLSAARRGELGEAQRRLDEAAVVTRALAADSVPQALCRSTHAAVDAYVLYRHGRFDVAWAALRASNAADLLLLERFGVPIMHMHRVQLVHNLARIEARRGDSALAADILDRLTVHLCGASVVDLPLPGPWTAALAEQCPVELVAAMIHGADVERRRWAVTHRDRDGLNGSPQR